MENVEKTEITVLFERPLANDPALAESVEITVLAEIELDVLYIDGLHEGGWTLIVPLDTWAA